MKKKKLKSISSLLRKADKLFSDFIRERDNYTCITCGKKGDKKDIDCGHFRKRHIMNLRFHLKNAHAQCTRCNRYLDGNEGIYAIRLIDKYGVDILYELEELEKEYKKGLVKYGRDFLESIIKLYL